jgi:hypothetical protein
MLQSEEVIMIVKNAFMVNIRSMSDLPLFERWLLRDHCAETISGIGPALVRYQSYRAVNPPPEMHADCVSFGYYNWRLTELWMDPMIIGSLAHNTKMIYPPNYSKIAGMGDRPAEQLMSPTFEGKPEGPHPPAGGGFPPGPTNDFLGKGQYLDDKTILRWVIMMKYPQGVPVEEGEKWFLEVHSKEVMQQPGLTRFLSYKGAGPPGRPVLWNRLTELWYENFDNWKKAVIDSPPKYTKPSWATYDKYPFLLPYTDFCSTFILEKPTNNFLRDYNGYVTSL